MDKFGNFIDEKKKRLTLHRQALLTKAMKDGTVAIQLYWTMEKVSSHFVAPPFRHMVSAGTDFPSCTLNSGLPSPSTNASLIKNGVVSLSCDDAVEMS